MGWYYEDFEPGRVIETPGRTVTEADIGAFAGLSGDFNPLHTDEVFTTKIAGYPSVFAHGMLSMGLTGTLLTDALGNGTLRTFGVRFRSQVWPGDTLTATATITEVTKQDNETLVALEVETVNQKGEVVVSGTATAALPS